MFKIDEIEYSNESISKMWESATQEEKKNEFWNKVYKKQGELFSDFLSKNRELPQ